MKISVDQSALSIITKMIKGPALGKTTMPILSHILVETNGAGIKLSSNNLVTSITGRVCADVRVGGSVSVPAKTFHSVVSALSGQLDISVNPDNFFMKIKTKRSKYRIACMSGDDFPSMQDVSNDVSFNIAASCMIGLLDAVLHAVEVDDIRVHLNSVLFENIVADDCFLAVATNGHVLAKCAIGAVDGLDKDVTFQLPRSSMVTLASLIRPLGDDVIKVHLGDNMHKFDLGTGDDALSFVSTSVGAKFPPWRRVIPSGNKNILEVDKSELLDAVRRVALVQTGRIGDPSVCFHMSPNSSLLSPNGTLTLSGENPDKGGEGLEHVPASYSGDPMVVQVNLQYLMDSVKPVPGDLIKISFKDSTSAVLIAGDDNSYEGVVMPIRL